MTTKFLKKIKNRKISYSNLIFIKITNSLFKKIFTFIFFLKTTNSLYKKAYGLPMDFYKW